MQYHELNLDGLVGPTHLFSGLSYGNIASETHKDSISNPKAAALQGLEKMKFLADLGIKQAIMPPQLRPRLDILQARGYKGSPEQILKQCYQQDFKLFCAVSSSSSMWTANAATISSSLEARLLSFTPANLSSKFHRSIETAETATRLQTIFPHATHHPALDSRLRDEGAANHTRLAPSHSKPGIDFFVYGYSIDTKLAEPHKFPARQALEASQAIIKNHGLNLERVVLAQQSTKAIDAGVFHNDVISTGNCNLFIYHEFSFENQNQVIEELVLKYQALTNQELMLIAVKENEVSLKQAVSSYLFNSQIVSLEDGSMLMLAPLECKKDQVVNQFLTKLIASAENPISKIEYFDLRESMNNGGGPACLRLRVVLSDDELRAMSQNYLLTDELYNKLAHWVQAHYPAKLEYTDLLEPDFYGQILLIFDKLGKIL